MKPMLRIYQSDGFIFGEYGFLSGADASFPSKETIRSDLP
jgi:hypothetical protein